MALLLRPAETFRRRIQKADSYKAPKRGRPSLFTADETKVIADVVAAFDHLKRPKATGAVITMIHDHYPQYTRKQIRNAWHHSIKCVRGAALGTFTKQDSSPDRTNAITIFNQTFYHELVTQAWAFAKARYVRVH